MLIIEVSLDVEFAASERKGRERTSIIQSYTTNSAVLNRGGGEPGSTQGNWPTSDEESSQQQIKHLAV